MMPDTEIPAIPLIGLGLTAPSLQQYSYQSNFRIHNTSPMLPPNTLKYGRRQAIGRSLQQWIECPESDLSVQVCPILPSTLNFNDLKESKDLEIDMEIHPYIPLQIEDDFAELEIMGPTGGAWEKISINQPDTPRDDQYSDIHIWEGQVAPGVLIVEEIKKAPGLFMSEVCQAIYQKHFPIDTLTYVYLIDVINKDTRSFVREELYTESNGLAWPDDKVRDWISGTPEYEALLGTTLGRTVGRLILGAFKRGTRRISRIRTFHSFGALQMQFAIEDIEQFATMGSQYPSDRSVESTDSMGPQTRSTSRRRQTIELRKRKLDWDEETESKRLRRE